jgi:hypothetical protein
MAGKAPLIHVCLFIQMLKDGVLLVDLTQRCNHPLRDVASLDQRQPRNAFLPPESKLHHESKSGKCKATSAYFDIMHSESPAQQRPKTHVFGPICIFVDENRLRDARATDFHEIGVVYGPLRNSPDCPLEAAQSGARERRKPHWAMM